MILFDLSSAFHKNTHRLAKSLYQGKMLDMKEHSKAFYLGLLYIIDEYSNTFRSFGEPVLALDDKSGQVTWRKEIYPMYKSARQSFRDSQITFDYKDAYYLYNNFLEVMKECSGIKTLEVPRCEADDIILVVGEEHQISGEPLMILSPDKDFVQLQTVSNIEQYSWMTNKYVTIDEKGGMNSWILEHICLGDKADCVPRIVDFQEYRPGVKEYLLEKGIDLDPFAFSNTKYDPTEFEQFGGVFKTTPFGMATLKKKIKACGDLKSLLESNSTLMRNFIRNKQLVMLDGIPASLKEDIKKALHSESPTMNVQKLAERLDLDIQDLPDFWKNKYIMESNFKGW